MNRTLTFMASTKCEPIMGPGGAEGHSPWWKVRGLQLKNVGS